MRKCVRGERKMFSFRTNCFPSFVLHAHTVYTLFSSIEHITKGIPSISVNNKADYTFSFENDMKYIVCKWLSTRKFIIMFTVKVTNSQRYNQKQRLQYVAFFQISCNTMHSFFSVIRITTSVSLIGSGMFIIPNTLYNLTCSYDIFNDISITLYKVKLKNEQLTYTIRYQNSTGLCYYSIGAQSNKACTVDICSCDNDGLSNHLRYNHTSLERGVLVLECTTAGSNSELMVRVAGLSLFIFLFS